MASSLPITLADGKAEASVPAATSTCVFMLEEGKTVSLITLALALPRNMAHLPRSEAAAPVDWRPAPGASPECAEGDGALEVPGLFLAGLKSPRIFENTSVSINDHQHQEVPPASLTYVVIISRQFHRTGARKGLLPGSFADRVTSPMLK